MLKIFEEWEQENFDNTIGILKDLKVPYEVLSPAQVNAKHKPFKINDSCKVVTEVYGGTLMASKCLGALQVGQTILLILIKYY